MENPSVLIVDDDREIAVAIKKLLEREGIPSVMVHDGMEALDALVAQPFQLIIMDVMMPKLDGLSATMQIRGKRNIPIIILSAKSEDSDKVLGLSMGADDYVTKPFNPSELVARVKSQLRRYLTLGSADTMVNSPDTITIGNLTLNTQEKQIYVDGTGVRLTSTEYRILELLMGNPGRVFSAEEIYTRVWQEDAYAVENTVVVHIRRIREKIEINPKEPKYLKVVWGIGYKIEKN